MAFPSFVLMYKLYMLPTYLPFQNMTNRPMATPLLPFTEGTMRSQTKSENARSEINWKPSPSSFIWGIQKNDIQAGAIPPGYHIQSHFTVKVRLL